MQAGDTTARLDAAAGNALHTNGATLRDLAANDAVTTVATGPGTTGSLANASNIVIDTTAPSVTNVTSTPTTASYKGGQTVHLTVGFGEPVRDVMGTPTLARNDGGTASYASGTGTASLVFDYVVGAGENVSPSPTPAPEPGAERRHDPGRGSEQRDDDAACPGVAGSLDANTTLTIDTTAPTVTGISATNANGCLQSGDVIHVRIGFSEPVTVTGTPALALENGASSRLRRPAPARRRSLSTTPCRRATTSHASTRPRRMRSRGTVRDGAENDATRTRRDRPGELGRAREREGIRIDTTALPQRHDARE